MQKLCTLIRLPLKKQSDLSPYCLQNMIPKHTPYAVVNGGKSVVNAEKGLIVKDKNITEFCWEKFCLLALI